MAAAVNIDNNINVSSFFGGSQPKEYIYEDEQCFAFDEDYEDRQAPIHFLVVPKKIIPRLVQASEEDEKLLGHILLVAKDLAIQKGLHKNGYHLMLHDDHLKKKLKAVHVFGRALHHMIWPVGPGCRL
ncbi:hypothetical protein K1T71_014221 [Dendrolimus kikuchii]|uniref:Uncharacterized protein n=1 Tax=Dendrolimus kikuchii TaxID=765133 RepID=A0ACC1CFJ2_9NEOP|nr:hypothetical protein K1T71_014221 [Dendrolimus kikuchii]